MSHHEVRTSQGYLGVWRSSLCHVIMTSWCDVTWCHYGIWLLWPRIVTRRAWWGRAVNAQLAFSFLSVFNSFLWPNLKAQTFLLHIVGEPCSDINNVTYSPGEEWSEGCDCNVCYEGAKRNYTVTYGYVPPFPLWKNTLKRQCQVGKSVIMLDMSGILHSPKFIPIEIGISSLISNIGWNSKLNTD